MKVLWEKILRRRKIRVEKWKCSEKTILRRGRMGIGKVHLFQGAPMKFLILLKWKVKNLSEHYQKPFLNIIICSICNMLTELVQLHWYIIAALKLGVSAIGLAPLFIEVEAPRLPGAINNDASVFKGFLHSVSNGNAKDGQRRGTKGDRLPFAGFVEFFSFTVLEN